MEIRKPQLLDTIFTSLHYMKTTRSDEGLMFNDREFVIFVRSSELFRHAVEKQFVPFIRSSELFWNVMEKQFVSRTRTTNNNPIYIFSLKKNE